MYRFIKSRNLDYRQKNFTTDLGENRIHGKIGNFRLQGCNLTCDHLGCLGDLPVSFSNWINSEIVL